MRRGAIADRRANTLAKAQEGERRAHGFDSKLQQEGDESSPAEMQEYLTMIDTAIKRIVPADLRDDGKTIEGEVNQPCDP